MKKFLIFTVLAFFAFLGNGHSELEITGPSVSATTGSVPGKDTYVTEIYYWDATSQSHKLEDRYQAHIKLESSYSSCAGQGLFFVMVCGRSAQVFVCVSPSG